MNISPRGNEWQPIAEMLDSGEYDSPRALAQAIVKHAYEVILEREWYLIVVKLSAPDDPQVVQVGYGLFASRAEATKVGQTLGRPYMVLSVTSGTEFMRRWAPEVAA